MTVSLPQPGAVATPGKITTVIDLVPGQVVPLAVIDASELTPERFRREYVHRHQPLLIRRAASGWPALAKWSAPGYLEARSGDMMAKVGRGLNPAHAETYVLTEQHLAGTLAAMRAAPADATYSIPAFAVPRPWEHDLGGYGFLDAALDRKPRMYPRNRLFVYRNASTEWHYHPFDETITTQLGGAKRISLFRLTGASWLPYSALIESGAHHAAGGRARLQAAPALVKLEGVLQAGDAVYIPPFWWHGIDPTDATMGFTLAHCFRSPVTRLAAWRDPITRRVLQGMLARRKAAVPIALALIMYSTLRRKLAGESWY